MDINLLIIAGLPVVGMIIVLFIYLLYRFITIKRKNERLISNNISLGQQTAMANREINTLTDEVAEKTEEVIKLEEDVTSMVKEEQTWEYKEVTVPVTVYKTVKVKIK